MLFKDVYPDKFMETFNEILKKTVMDPESELADFVDVRKIIENAGYTIVEEELGEISGYVIKDTHTITINKSDVDVRKNFTLGHELGHILQDVEFAERNPDINTYTHEERRDEIFANKFSAALLMPKKLIVHHIDELVTSKQLDREKLSKYDVASILEDVAHKMKVSTQALEISVNRYGLFVEVAD